MGRTLSQEAMDTLYPDPNKKKLQRNKDIFSAASNGGQIQPTPYELASGAKTPTPVENTGVIQKNNSPGSPLGVTVGAPVGKKAVIYDETSFRNPQIKARGADTPRIGAELGPGLTITQDGQGTVSLFNADGTKADPSKIRLSGGNLGGTPLPAGQSPFFMKSEAAKGLVPQPGPDSANPGTPQAPAATMLGGNMTGMFAQDDAIFKARMANIGKDYRVGAGNPAFANDPQMAQLLARRDSLQSSVDTFNRQNPLDRGARVGDIISNRAATHQQRKEIEGLNKDIFGRSDLGTKLQMAMLDSLTKKDISQGENQTTLAKQNMENQGQWDTRTMMEGNENMRHLANLQAGVGQPKPGEDPWDDKFLAEVGKDYFKALREGGNPGDMDEYLKQAKSYALKARAGKKGMLADILKTE
ncbi:MAG: hypothetical protein EOM03_11060 [Clostridia bacterium]|nr:hypothetical protein [Clostridia bacterium]